MPAYSEEKQREHMERVREVLALNPRMGKLAIRNFLMKQKNPIVLDAGYILKLKRKIERERIHRFDNAKVEKRISEMEDKIQSVIARMFSILANPMTDARAKVAAGKVIVDSEIKLFQAQLDAGIFERKFGTMNIEIIENHYQKVLHAFANFGIVKPQKNATDDTKNKFPSRRGDGKEDT